MKTPFGIHAEYVSERAVNNCINMYKKDQHNIVEGKSGVAGVNKKIKDSLDCPINVDEIPRLKIWHKEMHKIIDNYIRKFPILTKHEPWGYIEGLNIQYYKPGGGYPQSHCERMGRFNRRRLIAFMTYLTNTKDAGTEWIYLKWKSQCKKGLTLLWPVDYPYTHRGIISKTEEKMIITGWLGFENE